MPKNCFLCLSINKQPQHIKITLHKFPKDVETREKWLKICGLSEELDDISKIRLCSRHFTYNDYIEPNAKLLGKKLKLKRGAIPSIFVPYPLAFDIPLDEAPSEYVIEEIPLSDDSCVIMTEDVYEECLLKSVPSVVESPSSAIQYGHHHHYQNPPSTLSEPDATGTGHDGTLIKHLPRTKSQVQFKSSRRRRFLQSQLISDIRVDDLATPKGAGDVLSMVKRIDNINSKRIKSLQDKHRYLMKRVDSLKKLIADFSIFE